MRTDYCFALGVARFDSERETDFAVRGTPLVTVITFIEAGYGSRQKRCCILEVLDESLQTVPFAYFKTDPVFWSDEVFVQQEVTPEVYEVITVGYRAEYPLPRADYPLPQMHPELERFVGINFTRVSVYFIHVHDEVRECRGYEGDASFGWIELAGEGVRLVLAHVYKHISSELADDYKFVAV